MMTGHDRRVGDADLLRLVGAVTASGPPAQLTHAEVVAAGRAAWTWRTVGVDLDHLLGDHDRLGDQ